MRKRTQWLIAATVCAVVVAAVAWAATPYCPSTGWQKMYLTNTGTNAYTDTGIGFYKIVASGSDSIVQYGVYLKGCPKTAVDTSLADTTTTACGAARRMTGKLTNGSATVYIHTAATPATDTGRITYSGSWSDSAGFATYGSWSSTMTNGNGYAYDTYLWAGVASGSFVDTASNSLTAALRYETNTVLRVGNGTFDTTIIYQGPGGDSTTSRVRIVIFKEGYPYADSMMAKGGNSIETSWTTVGHFETGAYEFYIIGWDTATQKQYLNANRLSIAAANAGATNATAGVTSVTATMPGSNVTQRIQCSNWDNSVITISVMPLNCGNAKADSYAQYDTNTSNFDTRIANSVFDITPMDVNGTALTYISGGMTIIGTVDTSVAGLNGITLSRLQGMSLLHLNQTTGQWEQLSTTWNGRTFTVANVKNYSPFALGNIASSSTPSADSSDCLITDAFGGTALSRMMPSLRGVRDAMMGNALGRLFVSGYYGFSLMMLLAAGFGLTVALKRR